MEIRQRKAGNGYIQIYENFKWVYLHRKIFTEKNGIIPDGMQIDHINGITDDNRIENLRCVTQKQNQQNRKMPKTNKSGIVGVSITIHNKWYATIWKDGKQISLGIYLDFFEAICARKSAEIKYGFHKNHGRKM